MKTTRTTRHNETIDGAVVEFDATVKLTHSGPDANECDWTACEWVKVEMVSGPDVSATIAEYEPGDYL